jgi:hypothetical protein
MHRLKVRLCTWLCFAIAATTLLTQPAAADDLPARQLHVFIPIPATASIPPGEENQQEIVFTNVGKRQVISTHIEYLADQPAIRFAKTLFEPGDTNLI